MTAEQHCSLKLPIRLDDFRGIFEGFTDTQRLEVIKSLIWTSADNHGFYAKVMKALDPKVFEQTLD